MTYNSIALAGLPGSGKSTLCNSLSDKLNWPIISIGELFREKHKKERPDLTFEHYWSDIVTDTEIYKINNEAKTLLRKGHIVLDSRYAVVNAIDVSTCLCVFLKADIKTRAERAFGNPKYDDMNVKQIEDILQERENEEIKRGKDLYSDYLDGIYDYTNISLYHLVLDSESMTIEEENNEVLSKIFNTESV